MDTASRVEQQAELNRASEQLWSGYAHHRHRVVSFVVDLLESGASDRVAILGAGNLNDLDVEVLLEVTGELHLFDIDLGAVTRGLERQSVDPARVRVRQLDLLSSEADGFGLFDVVVSTNVLTQLIDQGTGQPGVSPLEIRDRHVDAVLAAVAPGGAALMVLDVVSSSTLADLGSYEEEALPDVLVRCLETGNFFSGCNPFAMGQAFDVRLGGPHSGVSRPWRWDLGTRSYLCCAVAAQRPADT